jgi:hypothetical protein
VCAFRFRGGKSYFASLMLGVSRDVFGMGHTVGSHTKGIWCAMKEADDHILMVVDSEGTSAAGAPAGSGGRVSSRHVMILLTSVASPVVAVFKRVFQSSACFSLTGHQFRFETIDYPGSSGWYVCNQRLEASGPGRCNPVLLATASILKNVVLFGLRCSPFVTSVATGCIASYICCSVRSPPVTFPNLLCGMSPSPE